jgi:hypothetical protein
VPLPETPQFFGDYGTIRALLLRSFFYKEVNPFLAEYAGMSLSLQHFAKVWTI